MVGVQLGGKAHFGVDDPVVSQVLDALDGDALECVGGLHNADGVGEALEIAHEVAPGRGRYEPCRSSSGSVVGRSR